MKWQDVVLGLGCFVFAFALLPTVLSKQKPHRTTAALSAIIQTLFAVTLGTLDLWLGTIGNSLCALSWWIILVQKRNTVPDRVEAAKHTMTKNIRKMLKSGYGQLIGQPVTEQTLLKVLEHTRDTVEAYMKRLGISDRLSDHVRISATPHASDPTKVEITITSKTEHGKEILNQMCDPRGYLDVELENKDTDPTPEPNAN